MAIVAVRLTPALFTTPSTRPCAAMERSAKSWTAARSGDVDDRRRGAPPEPFHAARRLREALLVDVADGDVAPAPRELDRERPPDPPTPRP
ncbi:MAG: hypothetical protein M5U28_50055 [Sandaracinaceae bacterium]|nr:hypothetical protein [Sandaracinaceae bacterium]